MSPFKGTRLAFATLAFLGAGLSCSSLSAVAPTVAGVRGGVITSIYYDTKNSGNVYAGAVGGGLFKSTDGGDSWTQIFLPNVALHFTNLVYVSTKTSGLVFVCEGQPSDAAIWRSNDGGANFSNTLSSNDRMCTTMTEGVNANTLYAGVITGNSMTAQNSRIGQLYKSSDAGASWTPLAVSTAGTIISDIIQLPSGRLVVGLHRFNDYYGLGGNESAPRGAIYYSDNDGGSWTAVSNATQTVVGFASNGSGTLLAATVDDNAIFISSSTDGQNWSMRYAAYTTGGGSIGGAHYPLHYHPGTDTFFLLVGSSKLHQSGAGPNYAWAGAPANIVSGLTNPIKLSLTGNAAFAVDPFDATGATILVGDGGSGDDGIFKTENGGANWSISNDGLYSPAIDMAVKSLSAGYRYAANSTGFVFFSAGAFTDPWTTIYRPTQAPGEGVEAIAFDYANPKRMFVTMGNTQSVGNHRLMRNSDVTVTAEDASPFNHTGWTAITHPDGGNTTILALLVDGATLYAGLTPYDNSDPADQYLYKSVDNGGTWNPLNLTTLGGVRSLAFDPSNHGILYAGSGDQRGRYNNPMHSNGIWKSVDAGATWARLDSNATLNAQSPRTIIIDTTTTSRVWLFADQQSNDAGNDDNDIWESLNGGASWTQITPNNTGSRFSLTYAATEGALLLGTGGSTINVYGLVPGSCAGPSCAWQNAFGVYGEAQVMYNGSVGVGTPAGLFSNSGFTLTSGSGGGGWEPDLVSLTQVGTSSMVVTFSDESDDETHFVIYAGVSSDPTVAVSTIATTTEAESGDLYAHTLTGLEPDTCYYVRVRAYLDDTEEFSDYSHELSACTSSDAESVTESVPTDETQTLTFTPPFGLVTLVIAPGTFGQSVQVTLEVPHTIPEDPLGSLTGQLVGTDVAVEITNDLALSPLREMLLTLTYRASDVTGLDESRLVIARYDASRGVWVPYESTVDTANNTVTARPNHFSVFQLMQLSPAVTVNSARVFPNPFRPSLGHTAINFANLPAHARVRIYTLRGQRVQEFSATAAGIASWNGKSESGQDVASGVYFALMEGAGEKKTFKLAVER